MASYIFLTKFQNNEAMYLHNLYIKICQCLGTCIENVKTKSELIDAIARKVYFEKWQSFDCIVLDFDKHDLMLSKVEKILDKDALKFIPNEGVEIR